MQNRSSWVLGGNISGFEFISYLLVKLLSPLQTFAFLLHFWNAISVTAKWFLGSVISLSGQHAGMVREPHGEVKHMQIWKASNTIDGTLWFSPFLLNKTLVMRLNTPGATPHGGCWISVINRIGKYVSCESQVGYLLETHRWCHWLSVSWVLGCPHRRV